MCSWMSYVPIEMYSSLVLHTHLVLPQSETHYECVIALLSMSASLIDRHNNTAKTKVTLRIYVFIVKYK